MGNQDDLVQGAAAVQQALLQTNAFHLSYRHIGQLTAQNVGALSYADRAAWQQVLNALDNMCANNVLPCGGDRNGGEQQGNPPIPAPGQPQARKGSKYWIGRYINERAGLFSKLLLAHSPSLSSFADGIEWVSPIAPAYAEFGDAAFLEALGCDDHWDEMQRFWPNGGPRWDGLGIIEATCGQGALLVEAKSYPAEATTRCQASDPASIAQIRQAFTEVQAFLNIAPRDWCSDHYQLANRVAHLYFLNHVAKVPTWLALVNFVNDQTHTSANRSTSLVDWASAQGELIRWLGVHPTSPLLDRMIPIFIDVSADRQ